ncbi:PREDICTED: protein asteroid homolog 1-like [Acropora digitifera]|uniref:protein asteroid homolog 1-like n=1 Tax=Acropora digitifera TaxID=70779 RepID=UPI00077AAF95|nr:PREDICTED: protein asteroid homolog 1-like [Acropora digitifera]
MGIPRLTSFVNSTENLWTTIDLHDTKLVIDGMALYFYLYGKSGLDCRCGGQYDEFYQAVIAFFLALKSKHVDCFVVFDGTIDPSGKKLKTIKSRVEQSIEAASELSRYDASLFVIPLLSAQVFKQALRDNSIPFVVCDRGNDYVSEDALVDFNSALGRVQTGIHFFGEKEAKFARIASFLRGLPRSCSQEEALKSTLKLITSQRSRNTLQHVIELSLQEYKIKESNLLHYFEKGLIHSSLRTLHGKQEIEGRVLSHFRAGKFSIESMNSLTSGRNLLGIQVDNFKERSSNCCSLGLRKFVYGILSDVGTDDGKRNITTVQEYDRQGFKFTASTVEPNIGDSVPGLSLVRFLEAEQRYNMFLFALDTNTDAVSSLPESDILIASSLRYLINHAEPAVKTNHLKALLCCWVLLKNSLGKCKSGERRPTKSSSTFCLQAAHSFCQWQCVVRDAIVLNYILLEPVPSPHIHEVFCGTLSQNLHGELQKGRSVEELPRVSSSDLQSYRLLYSAVTKDLSHKIATQEHTVGKRIKKGK